MQSGRHAGKLPNVKLLFENKSKATEQEEPVRRKVARKIIKLGMDIRSAVARYFVGFE